MKHFSSLAAHRVASSRPIIFSVCSCTSSASTARDYAHRIAERDAKTTSATGPDPATNGGDLDIFAEHLRVFGAEHAQVPVDVVSESQAVAGQLDRHRVCYLSGPNLTRAAGITPPIACDVPLVDAVFMVCEKGALIPLANHTLQPIERLALRETTGGSLHAAQKIRRSAAEQSSPFCVME